MNNREVYNPHLDDHTRNVKRPPIPYESKENESFCVLDHGRDFVRNNPNTKIKNPSGRIYLDELRRQKKS